MPRPEQSFGQSETAAGFSHASPAKLAAQMQPPSTQTPRPEQRPLPGHGAATEQSPPLQPWMQMQPPARQTPRPEQSLRHAVGRAAIARWQSVPA
eukprot:1422743-Prymnesium_polylepis.1